jgi:hypothetical protein
MQNFIGKDGFNWWMGVVESREDPLHLGRVQVRIFGWHTENMQEMPAEDLPWATPAISPNATMTNGTPLVGDFAFGFFSDGQSGQAPVILGVFPGIPQSGPNTSSGFSAGTHYPIGEPTTSRLYRNEKIDQTIIQQHNDNVDTGVATASGGSWSEPKSQYATKPPYNRVTETESGHVFELDDTPGAERIQLSHKAGTFFEIAPDGSKVTKVSGENYEIFIKDNNVHVKGQCNITVDGNAGIYVKGDATQKVDGSVNWTVGKDVNMQIGGKFIAKASEFDLTGDVYQTGNMNITGHEYVGGGISAGRQGSGGDITTVGNINIIGNVTATGDVVGGGKSLDSHVHSGVQPGSGTTGPPQ